MSREDELAASFLAARPRLVAIAYAILGSSAEAEDVVADTWLRLARADGVEPVRDVNGWAVVAVARGALDAYRSARLRREVYVGPWLPEPRVEPLPLTDPADRVTLDEQVSFAMLVVLESLSPAERTSAAIGARGLPPVEFGSLWRPAADESVPVGRGAWSLPAQPQATVARRRLGP